MASFPKVATDFDQIIQADRQRRKNEELAKEIFGRNKQNNNNKKKDDKRSSRNSTPTLASRIGIAKRSSSASSTNLQSKFQSKPRNSLPGQNARANRIAKELNLDTATNLPASQPSNPFNATASTGTGISIKGASGPFVLHASNFAPGTTAADIESALHPDTIHSNGVSALVSCKIVSAKADVVAELVFTEKIVAESIIGKYNGQKADGRILRVELVRSGVGSMSKGHGQSQQQQQQQQQQPQQRQDKRDRQPRQQQLQPQSQSHQAVTPEPELEFEAEVQLPDDNIIMEDIEMDAEPSAAPDFNDEREAADRDRRNRDSRRDRHEHYDSKRRDGEDDRPRNNRDRDRDRDRERDGDRDTNRDINRDREFERRDERPRDDRRGTMASHYGNGVGGGNSGPRGGFGGDNSRGGYGSYRGNRYNDGYGGGRGGGYRGGYNRGYRG